MKVCCHNCGAEIDTDRAFCDACGAKNLHRGYYKKHSSISCATYKLRLSNEVYEKAMWEVAQIMADSNNYHFNIWGLFLCQFNLPYHRKHHFFCFQFVSEVLCRSRTLDFSKDTSFM